MSNYIGKGSSSCKSWTRLSLSKRCNRRTKMIVFERHGEKRVHIVTRTVKWILVSILSRSNRSKLKSSYSSSRFGFSRWRGKSKSSNNRQKLHPLDQITKVNWCKLRSSCGSKHRNLQAHQSMTTTSRSIIRHRRTLCWDSHHKFSRK